MIGKYIDRWEVYAVEVPYTVHTGRDSNAQTYLTAKFRKWLNKEAGPYRHFASGVKDYARGWAMDPVGYQPQRFVIYVKDRTLAFKLAILWC